LTSKEDHERKMDIIQEKIEAAHQRIKEKADNTLKNISDNYQNQLLEKVAEELKLAKEALAQGNDRKAEQHKIRAEVYKSTLDAIRR
jgi:hypothetical protein